MIGIGIYPGHSGSHGSGGGSSAAFASNARFIHLYDEGSGTDAADATGNGHNGTLSGSASFTQLGVDFAAANAVVTVADDPELRLSVFTQMITFLCPSAGTVDAGGSTLMGKGTYGSAEAGNDNYFLYLDNEGGDIILYGRFEEADNTKHTVSFGDPLTPGVAYTVHLRYDGAEVTIFLDETEGTPLATAVAPVNNTSDVVVGYSPGAPAGRDFDGIVICDGLWGTALVDADILGNVARAKEILNQRGYASMVFGVVTDLHMADRASEVNTGGERFFQDADEKLAAAVTHFNTVEDLAFVTVLGDYTDGGGTADKSDQLGFLATVETEMDALVDGDGDPLDRHYVCGNHDMENLTLAEFLAGVDSAGTSAGAEGHYYSFDQGGVHFVVLDACFETDDDNDHYSEGAFNYQNTYVNPAQRTWLTADLAATVLPTVVFCHQVLHGATIHSVDNNAAVRAILNASGKVVAVFSGHTHSAASTAFSGIDYHTLEALVDGAYPTNAYHTISVSGAGTDAVVSVTTLP